MTLFWRYCARNYVKRPDKTGLLGNLLLSRFVKKRQTLCDDVVIYKQSWNPLHSLIKTSSVKGKVWIDQLIENFPNYLYRCSLYGSKRFSNFIAMKFLLHSSFELQLLLKFLVSSFMIIAYQRSLSWFCCCCYCCCF